MSHHKLRKTAIHSEASTVFQKKDKKRYCFKAFLLGLQRVTFSHEAYEAARCEGKQSARMKAEAIALRSEWEPYKASALQVLYSAIQQYWDPVSAI